MEVSMKLWEVEVSDPAFLELEESFNQGLPF
jgi:hypothetical protein